MKNTKRNLGVLKNGYSCLAASGAVFAAAGPGINCAQAHGFVGDYFFPPTIVTDDPFATDELLLPAISYIRSPPTTETTEIGFEFDKEIFPKFALGISGDYLQEIPQGQGRLTGWSDFSMSAKYQLWENAPHQAIVSVGGRWQIGGSGSSEVGADPANVFTPAVYFGKAFGDLPDSVQYARPFAVTAALGEDIPAKAEPNNFEWGFAVEYSLPYLQQDVKDIGLPQPFKKMIPLVEFAMASPENRGGGQTTGTINPGVLYENAYFQLGAEAMIPVNSASGHQVGVIVQLEIYIDDIFPKAFGFPIFGR